jgi:hypothetical protein
LLGLRDFWRFPETKAKDFSKFLKGWFSDVSEEDEAQMKPTEQNSMPNERHSLETDLENKGIMPTRMLHFCYDQESQC